MKYFSKLICGSLIVVVTTSSAVPLLLKHEPLYLNQTVPPALAVTFDDSGSMAWGFMPSGRSYSGNNPSTASPDYNEIYYNPTIRYSPPVRSDGTSFPDSSYNNAQFDGFYLGGNTGSALGGSVNLSNNFRMVWTSYPNYNTGATSRSYQNAARPGTNEGYYYLWNGPGNPTRDGANGTANGQYTRTVLNGASLIERTNFANWYTYYNTRGKLAKSAVSHAFVNFGPDFKIDWQQLNGLSFTATGANVDLFNGTHRQNFYNWLYQIPASGGTPLRAATRRAGELFTQGGTNGPYYDANFGAELSCQQNFHIAISDGGWNSAAGITFNSDNTPVTLPALDPTGVNIAYEYNTGSLPSSMYAGTQNSTLADNAFHYWNHDLRTDLPNQVPNYIEDHTDSNGNIVPIAPGTQWWEYPELFWNPLNDPATWQHLVNFNIGLGVTGSLDPTTQLSNLRDGTITSWPGTGTNQGLIDDVWHASLNSRGKYFSARDPQELAGALNQVVSNIIARKGRASAGAVSSNVVSNETVTYRTGFDTSDWSGFVIAQQLNADGTSGNVEWDAACMLTGDLCSSTGTTGPATNSPSSRKIITYDGTTGTVAFETSSIPTNLIDSLNNSPFLQANPLITVSQIIDYIRGDRSLEMKNGGFLRDRLSILGDVIHSPAQLIRGPAARYFDNDWDLSSPEGIAAAGGNSYASFREANKNRLATLLVGANDGMLHAFDAGLDGTTVGGHELWAYVPSSSYENMAELANPAYQHKTFVDAGPFIKDAFINSNWKTIALGGLRFGGKLFYALDLGNDPSQTPEVLWEFTDDDDPDMGYSYAGGVIARVYNPLNSVSKWVAFIPNGYSSTNDKAAMFAIDLESGALMHKWLSPLGSSVNPNGMGPPVAGDFIKDKAPNDTSSGEEDLADISTDFVYAGDLHGNVYKFDAHDIFSSTSVTNLSTSDMLYNGSIDRPITTAPRIFGSLEDGTQDIIVTFGTGKYIETPDRDITTTSPQYVIGLRDNHVGFPTYSLNDSRLVSQFLTGGALSGFREISSNVVSKYQSWKIELPSQGERMVNAMGRNPVQKILTTVSIIPTGLDPCLPGGQSWLMALDAKTGSTPVFGSLFSGGHKDAVYIEDLAIGTSNITTPGGNDTFINIDTIGGGISGDSVIIETKTKVWGRKSWHRIILE